jgi:MFS family permease
MHDFGLSFTGIGVTMTVFFIVSGIGQAMAGFLVDRFGAVRVLGGGITCFVLAGVVLYFATGYPMLIVVAALGGLGNSVFHPADFTVLNHRVSAQRLGHAFSVHGLSGNLGWAAAPVFLTGIATVSGWRNAALAASLVAVAALAMLFWRRHAIAEVIDHHADKAAEDKVPTFAF